jgi:hypothetical protein
MVVLPSHFALFAAFCSVSVTSLLGVAAVPIRQGSLSSNQPARHAPPMLPLPIQEVRKHTASKKTGKGIDTTGKQHNRASRHSTSLLVNLPELFSIDIRNTTDGPILSSRMIAVVLLLFLSLVVSTQISIINSFWNSSAAAPRFAVRQSGIRLSQTPTAVCPGLLTSW